VTCYGPAVRKRDYIDAKFEVISGPVRRYELPNWFKALMLSLATLFMLGTMLWRMGAFSDHDHATAPSAPAGGRTHSAEPVEPQAPPAR
jgi:hypothetical protein